MSPARAPRPNPALKRTRRYATSRFERQRAAPLNLIVRALGLRASVPGSHRRCSMLAGRTLSRTFLLPQPCRVRRRCRFVHARGKSFLCFPNLDRRVLRQVRFVLFQGSWLHLVAGGSYRYGLPCSTLL